MGTLSLIKDAREIINTGWTQQDYAQDNEGRYAEVLSDDASCFCIIGSLARASNTSVLSDDVAVAVGAITRTLEDDGFRGLSVVAFNDKEGRTKEEVVSLFDRTIERLSK